MVFTNKEEMVSLLREQIRSDKFTAWKALARIYENQTDDEKSSEFTKYDNGVGFSGADSEFLSSLAKQLIQWGSLSDKQTAVLYRLMPKYARQLVEGSISEGKIIYEHNKYFTTKEELAEYEKTLPGNKIA